MSRTTICLSHLSQLFIRHSIHDVNRYRSSVLARLKEEKDLEFNHRNHQGSTALQLASMNGAIDFVKLLLADSRCDVNATVYLRYSPNTTFSISFTCFQKG